MVCTRRNKVVDILSIDQTGMCLVDIDETAETHRRFEFILQYLIKLVSCVATRRSLDLLCVRCSTPSSPYANEYK